MSKEEFFELLNYIVKESIALKDEHIEEKDLPVDYLTIFAQSDEEKDKFTKVLDTLGEQIMNNNGPVYKLHQPFPISTGDLILIRVRNPDPKRPQRGDCDFRLENYPEFKAKYLGKNPHFSLMVRKDYEMIEIKDPKFDALVYFPDIPLTKDLGLI